MLVQKIFAPTRALQAHSAFHFSKSATSNEFELTKGFKRRIGSRRKADVQGYLQDV
jgi:hypothetical protein